MTFPKLRLSFRSLALLTMLSACAPPEETSDSAPKDAATGEASEAAVDGSAGEITLAETGWVTFGEDGTVYTTYFDADGTYRDLRNGEAFQQGSWQRREDGRVCFLPAAENRTGACWGFDDLGEDNTVRASSSQGPNVELKRAAYVAPETSVSEDEDEDTSADQGAQNPATTEG